MPHGIQGNHSHCWVEHFDQRRCVSVVTRISLHIYALYEALVSCNYYNFEHQFIAHSTAGPWPLLTPLAITMLLLR